MKEKLVLNYIKTSKTRFSEQIVTKEELAANNQLKMQ
jgi:hypothetical protein